MHHRVKRIFVDRFHAKNGRYPSDKEAKLEVAAEASGLNFSGHAHRGIDDAKMGVKMTIEMAVLMATETGNTKSGIENTLLENGQFDYRVKGQSVGIPWDYTLDPTPRQLTHVDKKTGVEEKFDLLFFKNTRESGGYEGKIPFRSFVNGAQGTEPGGSSNL